MKRCLACSTCYSSFLMDCASCGFSPSLVNGFRAYAPELAHVGGGFEPSHFSQLAQLEENSFWFQARNQLILWALEKYCQDFKSLLEIGCGTAYVLSGISKKFPQRILHGSEIFIAGLDFAIKRLPSINLMQMDARNIPFEEEFDVIGAFDVLEHIEEDEQVLKQVYAALKPEGFMLLTVPQHTWLWSSIDERAHHVRRYTASDLHSKIKTAGFQIIRSTSFVSTLLPAMIASRFFQNKNSHKEIEPTTELKLSTWLNSSFSQLMRIELALIKKGFNFPIGGSRLVVAKKFSHHSSGD